VNIKFVADPPVSGRDDERLPANGETDVTDEAFIKNPVNHLAIIRSPLWQSLQRCPLGGRETLHPGSLLVFLFGVKNNFSSGLVQVPLLRFNTSPLKNGGWWLAPGGWLLTRG
jgi:hypothetical protein